MREDNMSYRLIIITAIFTTTLLFLISCGRVNEIGYKESLEVPQNPKSAVYRMTKRYCLAVKGDTALFVGERVCTVFVNGKISKSRTTTDTTYHRTITPDTDTNNLISVPWKSNKVSVYPQFFQYIESSKKLSEKEILKKLEKSTITRYIEITDSTTEQVAYSQGRLTNNYKQPAQAVIMPHTIIAGDYGWGTSSVNLHRWKGSSLTRLPKYLKGDIKIHSTMYNVVTTPLALPNTPEMPPYFVNGYNYLNGILYDSYYSFYGEGFEDGQVVSIVGSIYMTTSRFADYGVIDIIKESFFQKSYADGNIEITKEKEYLVRAKKAKKFDEDTMFVRIKNKLGTYDGQLNFPE